MANLDAPMGFNPVGKIGSGPSQKAGEYKVTNDHRRLWSGLYQYHSLRISKSCTNGRVVPPL